MATPRVREPDDDHRRPSSMRSAAVLILPAALLLGSCSATETAAPVPSTGAQTTTSIRVPGSGAGTSATPTTTPGTASTAPTSTSTLPAATTPTTSASDDAAQSPTVLAGTYRLRTDAETPVGGGATLQLVAVLEDSRCPDGVQCAWEGELKARVMWRADGSQTALDLVWAYHADPTALPGTTSTLALDGVTGEGAAAVATVRIA